MENSNFWKPMTRKCYQGKVVTLAEVKDNIKAIERAFGEGGWELTKERLAEAVKDALDQAECDAVDAFAVKEEE